ncbi:MAG: F0F1 ATP synthase subunit B, partial [Alphaproteobacteria bacterium]
AEAEAIIAEAKEEAKRMQRASEERTQASLERREQQALDMIAAAEARAVADVRALAADVAIDATRRILTDVVQGQKGDELVNSAIAEVPGKLN